jgi:hypothetical protein
MYIFRLPIDLILAHFGRQILARDMRFHDDLYMISPLKLDYRSLAGTLSRSESSLLHEPYNFVSLGRHLKRATWLPFLIYTRFYLLNRLVSRASWLFHRLSEALLESLLL